MVLFPQVRVCIISNSFWIFSCLPRTLHTKLTVCYQTHFLSACMSGDGHTPAGIDSIHINEHVEYKLYLQAKPAIQSGLGLSTSEDLMLIEGTVMPIICGPKSYMPSICGQNKLQDYSSSAFLEASAYVACQNGHTPASWY